MASSRIDVTLRGTQAVTLQPSTVARAAAIGTPTIKTTGGGGGTVTTKMGMPANGNAASDGNWPAFRCYNFGAIAGALSRGATRIGLTDSAISPTGGTASANQLQTSLINFYGKTGAPSLHTNIIIDWGNGNEEDNKAHNVTSVANTYAAMRSVVDQFDNVSGLWFDATQHQIDIGNTPNFMNAIATNGLRTYQMLDGLAGSYYPPHRGDYPNMSASSYTQTNSTPTTVVGLFMSLIDTFTLPNRLSMTAIWEFGIPALITPPPPPFANSGSTVNNPVTRPNYIRAMAFKFMEQSVLKGLDPVMACYWDQQSGTPKGGTGNANPDNRLDENDAWFPTFHPTSAEAWRTAADDYNASL